MKKISLITAFFVLVLFGCRKDDYQTGIRSPGAQTTVERVPGRIVVAYSTYYGTEIPQPSYLTNINYAFAELYVKNGKYEKFGLQGDEARFQKIVNLKSSYPDLKISISLTNSVSNADNVKDGGFSALVKSPEDRLAFAKDCKAFLEKWGIDGIDIDWEFPGLSFSGMPVDPADIDNFTLLMKDLRQVLGTRYLLTYAGYCQDKQPEGAGYKYIDVKAVDPYVDFVNIMTYDLDEAPRPQSALRSSTAYFDCERAVNSYLNAGIDPGKLVLGIPFYGRHSFSGSESAIDYKKIIQLDSSVYKIDNWDEEGSVPYVTKNGQFYCGYDNEKSIAIKAGWILGLGMKGLMYWDYDGDDKTGTLRKAVWESTMKQ